MEETDRFELSRRQFLNRLGILSAVAALGPEALLAARRADRPGLPEWVADEPWLTLRALQNHLLPATHEAPGADEVHAIVYLRNTLERPGADSASREFLTGRVAALNAKSRAEYVLPFAELSSLDRELLLRELVRDSLWRRWLSRHLTFLLEALLADPVYGGNFNGAGWRWLEHKPGFPTPPEGMLWFQLGSEVYFRRKA